MNKIYDFLTKKGAKGEIATRSGVSVKYVSATLRSGKEYHQLTPIQQSIIRNALEYISECKAADKKLRRL